MKRITIGLLVVLGVVTAIVVLLLARPKDGTSPSSPSPEQDAVELPASRSDPIAGEIRIRPRPFDPAAEENELARARKHAAVAVTAARLLGEKKTPQRLFDKRLSDADLEALRVKIDELERRNQQLEKDYRAAGDKRLTEVYDAGGGMGVEEAVPIPGDGKPMLVADVIARKPFDDDAEDGTISQTFFSFGGRGPEARVVRLRPNTDEVWGAYVAAHRPKVEELRREVRSTLETYFGK